MFSRTTHLLRPRPSYLTTTLQLSRPASASSQPKQAKPALVYKGRIPRAEPPSSESAAPSSSPPESAAQPAQDTLEQAYKLPKIPGVGSGLGARIEGEQDPRKKYRYAESRLVRAMCAAPIAIVLTYVLYQRLFLGVEQKKLSHIVVADATE